MDVERNIKYSFNSDIPEIDNLAIQTAPGFDMAVLESSCEYLHTVSVSRYCSECNLKRECCLTVKVDKLANQIFINGRCLKT